MKIIVPVLIGILLVLATSKEKFTEIFGFSGYSKPILNVSINEKLNSSIDISNYEEKAALIGNDLLQELLFTVQRHLKMPTYAVETNSIKKFVDKTDPSKIIYRCRFMFIYTKGFPFGFGVSADILMTPKPTIVAITTQPQSDQTYSPVEPFTEGEDNFVNYNEVISNYSKRVVSSF
jgi:hypothetical protein